MSVVLSADDDPYLVFESLNAKGRPLTQADLIRNYFFMRIHADSQESVYAQYWQPMQDLLKDNLTEFIRHYLTKTGVEKKKEQLKNLTAVTNTRTKVKMAGFTGGVSIILLNTNRQPIWASSVHKYGVDGCWIGTCNRNDNWSDSVPPSILQQVRGYAILQEHTPKWLSLAGQRGEQFLRWLNSDEGKATVSTIVSIAAML